MILNSVNYQRAKEIFKQPSHTCQGDNRFLESSFFLSQPNRTLVPNSCIEEVETRGVFLFQSKITLKCLVVGFQRNKRTVFQSLLLVIPRRMCFVSLELFCRKTSQRKIVLVNGIIYHRKQSPRCLCMCRVRDVFILSFQLLLADTHDSRLRFIETVRFMSVSNYLHSFDIFTFFVTI